MTRPREYDRTQVLRDSIDLFWKQGFKDTSLQDIERATGVNKSALYSEFKDKDDLFVSGLEDYIQSSGIYELLHTEPLGWGNIEELLLRGNRHPKRKGCMVVNSVREFSILPKRARTLIQSHIEKIQAAVRENVEAANPKLNADEVTQLILTFNSGMCLAQNMGEIEDFASRIKTFLKLLKGK